MLFTLGAEQHLQRWLYCMHSLDTHMSNDFIKLHFCKPEYLGNQPPLHSLWASLNLTVCFCSLVDIGIFSEVSHHGTANYNGTEITAVAWYDLWLIQRFNKEIHLLGRDWWSPSNFVASFALSYTVIMKIYNNNPVITILLKMRLLDFKEGGAQAPHMWPSQDCHPRFDPRAQPAGILWSPTCCP